MELVRWVRLAAVPFALAEAAVEEYPPGDARWAWMITGVFVAGAVVLAGRPHAAAGLAFDTVLVSAYVILYAFEGGTPVRLLLVLPLLEGAVGYGVRGGVLVAVASLPALALFEWRSPFDPYDPGHVLGPFGIFLLVALVVGRLARGRSARW